LKQTEYTVALVELHRDGYCCGQWGGGMTVED